MWLSFFIFIFPHHSFCAACPFLARQIFHTHQCRLSPPDKLHYVRAASSNRTPTTTNPPPQWRAHGFCTWQRSLRTKSYSSEKHRTRVSCLMNRDINQECNLLSQIQSDCVLQKRVDKVRKKGPKASWRKSMFKINTNWWENSWKRSAERKLLCTTHLSPDAGLIAAVWEQLLPSQP